MTSQPQYRWDPAKNRANQSKHGLAFEDLARFDWDYALVAEDPDSWGEQRFLALGPIDNRLVMLVFVERADEVRAISLRKAITAEIRRWQRVIHG